MIYITIIAVALMIMIVLIVLAYVAQDVVTNITDAVHDLTSSHREARLEDYDSIGKLFTNMVYGPGQVPTKSAAEILKDIEEAVDKEALPYPLHETEDETLEWFAKGDPEVSLHDLPEHEEDDTFMNQGVED